MPGYLARGGPYLQTLELVPGERWPAPGVPAPAAHRRWRRRSRARAGGAARRHRGGQFRGAHHRPATASRAAGRTNWDVSGAVAAAGAAAPALSRRQPPLAGVRRGDATGRVPSGIDAAGAAAGRRGNDAHAARISREAPPCCWSCGCSCCSTGLIAVFAISARTEALQGRFLARSASPATPPKPDVELAAVPPAGPRRRRRAGCPDGRANDCRVRGPPVARCAWSTSRPRSTSTSRRPTC